MGSSRTDVPTGAQTICSHRLPRPVLNVFRRTRGTKLILDICFVCVCATSDCEEERGRLRVGCETREAAFL